MPQNLMNREKNHIAYYDVIRLIAIFLVIFHHTPAFACPFVESGESLFVFCAYFVSACAKVAVPLFFMMTGALLLPKQETIGELFKRRIVRFACVIVLFWAVQYVYYRVVHKGVELSVSDFLCVCYQIGEGAKWLQGKAVAHWFLYAYMAILLMLPLLRCMARNMESVHFVYLGILQIVFGALLPVLFGAIAGTYVPQTGIARYLYVIEWPLLFVLIGYYVEHRVNVQNISRRCMVMWILGALGSILLLCCISECARLVMHADTLHQYIPDMREFVLIPCCVFMLSMKKWFVAHPIPPKVCSCLRKCGSAVFTIMIVENILREEVHVFFSRYHEGYMHSLYVAGIVWIVGLCLGLLCKRIPLLNKLL